MAVIEKFLGKRVEIPEDRLYVLKQGLWAKFDKQDIVFGLSEPALVLIGGLKDLEWIATEGQEVQEGETVIFAITGKIFYVDTPVEGAVQFNPEVKRSPQIITEDPYDRGWLFRIRPSGRLEEEPGRLAAAADYLESLRSTEGAKNPEGVKGGVSGICKAVYSGIREQKL